MNSKLHAVCDGAGRAVFMRLSEGQMSDHKGAAQMLDNLPAAQELIADRGYDSDKFRDVLAKWGITPCIPPRKTRKVWHYYRKALYRPALRPMRPHLLLRHLHRSNPHLLSQSMSSAPRPGVARQLVLRTFNAMPSA